MPAASGLPSPGSASGGQGHEIEVAIPDGVLDAGRAARLVAAFEADGPEGVEGSGRCGYRPEPLPISISNPFAVHSTSRTSPTGR